MNYKLYCKECKKIFNSDIINSNRKFMYNIKKIIGKIEISEVTL